MYLQGRERYQCRLDVALAPGQKGINVGRLGLGRTDRGHGRGAGLDKRDGGGGVDGLTCGLRGVCGDKEGYDGCNCA